MTKRVLIINEGFSSNLGDQAIKESMEQLFQSFGYQTSFSYFTNPSLTKLPEYKYLLSETSDEYLFIRIKKQLARILSPLIYCRYFFSIRRKIKASLKNQIFDFAVIGGGQIINSSPKQRLSFFAIALYQWTRAIKKMGLQSYLVGVGSVGEFHSLEEYLYKKSLGNVNTVWVRDSYSQKSLKEHFGKESNLMPDIAFFESAAPKQFEKSNTALVGIYSYREYSGKMSNATLSRDSYYTHWKEVVQDFRRKAVAVILFYTTESDASETGLFQQFLSGEGIDVEVADIKSLDDLNKLYETADFVHSARMHALILGIKKGCKAEASVISQKLKSFADEYISLGTDPGILSEKVVGCLEGEFLISKSTSL